MIGLETSHENILITLLGGLGLVLVAMIPVTVAIINSRRDNRRIAAENQEATVQGLQDVKDHLPPNGIRLYEMVAATSRTVAELQHQLNKVELIVIQHLETHMDKKGEQGGTR